jgi:hypothetical protein
VSSYKTFLQSLFYPSADGSFQPWLQNHGSVAPSVQTKGVDSFFLRFVKNMDGTSALSAEQSITG